MAEQPQGFARRMMAQKLMADARNTPGSDSPFFAGRIRPSLADIEQPTRFSDMAMPAYSTGATASLFAPGAGVADIFGGAPDPFRPGEMLPSFGENIGQGNYLDAGLQTLGAAGDVALAAGALFPPALPGAMAVGTALKAPRAAKVAGQAADRAVDTVVFHGTKDKFDVFDMSKAEDGAHFFTVDKDVAENFGDVSQYRVRMENPYVIKDEQLENLVTQADEDAGIIPRDKIAGLVQQAKAGGFDGLVIEGFSDVGKQADAYLPFNSEQISPVTDPNQAAGAVDEANTLVDDLPTLRFDGTDELNLEGKKIFPIVADLTAAGGRFEGIDSSKLDAPELLQGGPEFPNLKGSRDAGVVWAVQGKGVGTKKLSKEADYGLVVAMNPDSHRSNATFVNSIVGNTLAYVRDGRINPENLEQLNAFVRTGTDQKQLQKLKNWPGFESPQAAEFVKSLNFEERKRIADVVGSSRGQALGAPNIDKIIRATGDPALLGLNSRDAIMLVELDKDADLIRLGTQGSLEHNSYEFGIKGRPIARIPATSAKNMFPDFFAQAEAEGKQNVRRAFDLALPVEELNAEKIENIRQLATQSIESPKQAALTADLLTGNWKSSKVAKNKGGVSPTDFVQNLKSSDASSTLTMMELPEVQKKIRGGKFDLYQLGDGEVFFGLEKGYNYDDVYGLSDNPTFVKAPDGPQLTGDEIALVSVINNEIGAKGVGKATVLKAIEEGATALDAFAVPSAKYSDGFLPRFYASFGFKEVGRIDFDPSFYSKQEIADLEDYWRSTGWDESQGFPKIAIMKWVGDDGLRANATKRFVEEGRFNTGAGVTGLFPAAESAIRTGDGSRSAVAQRQRAGGDAGRNIGGSGTSPRPLTPDKLAAVARELLTLPDTAVQNLGIDPSRLTQVRDDLGIFR